MSKGYNLKEMSKGYDLKEIEIIGNNINLILNRELNMMRKCLVFEIDKNEDGYYFHIEIEKTTMISDYEIEILKKSVNSKEAIISFNFESGLLKFTFFKQ